MTENDRNSPPAHGRNPHSFEIVPSASPLLHPHPTLRSGPLTYSIPLSAVERTRRLGGGGGGNLHVLLIRLLYPLALNLPSLEQGVTGRTRVRSFLAVKPWATSATSEPPSPHLSNGTEDPRAGPGSLQTLGRCSCTGARVPSVARSAQATPSATGRRCHGDARTQAGRARGVRGGRLETPRKRGQAASPRSGRFLSPPGSRKTGRKPLLPPGEWDAGGDGGRRRPGAGLRGHGLGGEAPTLPQPEPELLFDPGSGPRSLQQQPFVPKCSPRYRPSVVLWGTAGIGRGAPWFPDSQTTHTQ